MYQVEQSQTGRVWRDTPASQFVHKWDAIGKARSLAKSGSVYHYRVVTIDKVREVIFAA